MLLNLKTPRLYVCIRDWLGHQPRSTANHSIILEYQSEYEHEEEQSHLRYSSEERIKRGQFRSGNATKAAPTRSF